jgi:hypothetical protein
MATEFQRLKAIVLKLNKIKVGKELLVELAHGKKVRTAGVKLAAMKEEFMDAIEEILGGDAVWKKKLTKEIIALNNKLVKAAEDEDDDGEDDDGEDDDGEDDDGEDDDGEDDDGEEDDDDGEEEDDDGEEEDDDGEKEEPPTRRRRGKKKTTPKKPKKSKMTREAASIKALRKAGTLDDLSERADEIYVNAGGSSSEGNAKFNIKKAIAILSLVDGIKKIKGGKFKLDI